MGKHALAPMLLVGLLTTILTACGGSSGNNNSGSGSGSDQQTLSGTIRFEDVPQTSRLNAALDYDAAEPRPARRVTVQLLDSSGNVAMSSVTDENGAYSFNVGANQMLRLAVLAESKNSQWDIKITDNTNNHRQYALQGSLTSTGATNSTRDLLAQSGWTGNSYGNTRVAGPFAMLDVMQDIANTLDKSLPPLEVRWSANNRPSRGNLTDGDISTSFYSQIDGEHFVYILGAENTDTDEYDDDVIAHEFTHFLEAALSKSHSIGGSHGEQEALDLRVAYSEGLGNAVAAEYTTDGAYVDSFGSRQRITGVALDIESNNIDTKGWFIEGAVQKVIYDVMDRNNDGEAANLGLKGMFDVLESRQFKDSPAIGSIFLFEDSVRELHPNLGNTLDNLLNDMNISGRGIWGEGETNALFTPSIALPIYTELQLGGTANVCTSNTHGDENNLGNYRFLRFSTTTSTTRTIQVSRTSGPENTDPDILLAENGQYVARATSITANSEILTRIIAAGTHVIIINDFANTDGDDSTGGRSCFNVSVQ